MSAPEESFSPADQEAFAFCVRLLEEDAELTYKELRREARVREGLGLRRQVWTAARRKLGLISDAEGTEGGPPGHGAAFGRPDAPSAPAEGEARRERRRPAAEDPEGFDAPPAGRRPAEAPRRPRPDRGEEPAPRRDAGERIPPWRQGNRPTWATPAREERPVRPPPLVSPRPDGPPPTATSRPPAAFPPAPAPPASAPPPGGGTSAIEWMVEYLKTVNAQATFQEIRGAAERAGHQVYPATFGRAQAIAGLLEEQERARRSAPAAPAAPAAPRKAPAPAPAPPPAERRAPEKPTAVPAGSIDPVAGFEAFHAAFARAERGREETRRLMRRMLQVIERTLDPSDENG